MWEASKVVMTSQKPKRREVREMSSRTWLLMYSAGICILGAGLLVSMVPPLIAGEQTLMEMLPMGIPLAVIFLLAASGVVALLRERRKDP